jgi:dTDP-4-dehydrorhamnose 3,5-epimerase
MELKETTLKDAFLIKPKVFPDGRGFIFESYSKRKYEKEGIFIDFVQDNHSKSLQKGILRGLHFQNIPDTQAKLIRVTKGKVYDVIVDLRKDSPTFGKWEGFEISAENFLMIFVPGGFAHGFLTLEDDVEFQYKCDNFYAPQNESGIIWNDTTLNINWPIKNPILSEKDKKLPTFEEFIKNNPF